MNEKIEKNREMSRVDHEPRRVLPVILKRVLCAKPKEKVYYRPFKPCDHVRFTRTLSSQMVNLNEMYPEAEIGDGVITDFCIACFQTEHIYLNVSAGVQVWFCGRCIYDGIKGSIDTGEKLQQAEDGGDRIHLPILVQKNAENFVRILCVKKENQDFSFEFLISVKRYPFMWANDYLFWARATQPLGEMKGEEGVALSRLLKAAELRALNVGKADIVYQWPLMLSKDETFDFSVLCGEGDISYVYTEAFCDHTLFYRGNVECIYVNGEEFPAEGEIHIAREDTASGQACIKLKSGDRVLFRCRRNADGWKLWLDTTNLTLSFLTSSRTVSSRTMYAGPFFGPQCHGPEYDWDLSDIFVNEKGQKIYWGFCDGSRLRIYLDSIFYGQWFYALMVGFYGIRDAACYLGDKPRQRLFVENMAFLARYFAYIEYDIEKHVMPAFMPRIFEMNVLDNVGTMGMNLIDAYLDSSDKTLLPVIERIRCQAEETIPRMEDGTYYRLDTMWADDLYMSCPFLIRMGILMEDTSWYLKAAAQIEGFRKRLYMEDEHLFSHIFFPDMGQANRVPWGRGNGWVMWTLSEILMYGEGKIDLSREKTLFCQMAHRIRELQDKSGLWHQVLNRTEEGSYLETSCTGMFLLAFTRGVKYGWLAEDFLETIERAWKGLLAHSIDRDGNVYGVCMGSGCQMDAEYYFDIPTIINDDHGTGVILAAGAEYGALLEERNESAIAG